MEHDGIGRSDVSSRLDVEIEHELMDRMASRDFPEGLAEAAGMDFEDLEATILRIIEPPGFGGDQGVPDDVLSGDFRTERIIREFKRPSLLVRAGSFDFTSVVASDVWRQTLESHRSAIERALPGVGRIEVKNHSKLAWVGTGFLVAPDVLVTNRHVAEEFTRKDGAGFAWKLNDRGRRIQPRIDFREEHQLPDEEEFEITDVLFMEDDGPDMAFLRLDTDGLTAAHLDLQDDLTSVEFVGALGYPWRDSRVEPHLLDAMERYFSNIFDVKRFAPGKLMDAHDGAIGHDCSTLGGNSGSAIIDLASGNVIGLHYGGYEDYNVAIPASTLQQALDRV